MWFVLLEFNIFVLLNVYVLYSVHRSAAARSGIWILLLFTLAKVQISSLFVVHFTFAQLRSYHIFEKFL